MRFSSVALAAIGLTACGRAPSTQPADVRDSSGIRIVENFAPGWTAATRWRVGDTPLLTIGTASGDASYELSQVRGLTRLSDGRILALNGGSAQLRFYDPAGTFLGAAGRRGEGPGEFRRTPTSLFRLAGDSILVVVPGRLQVFGPDGRFVRVGARIGPDVQFGFPSVAFGDGSFLSLRVFARDPSLDTPRGTWPDSATVDWIAPSGSRATTLARVVRQVRYSSSVSSIGLPIQLGTLTQLTGTDDRFYLGRGDHYEIRTYTRTGNDADDPEWSAATLTAIIRRAVEPVPIPGQVQEEQRARFVESLGGGSRPLSPQVQAMAQRAAEEMQFAETFPMFSRLTLDRTGHLWVRHYDVREETPDIGGVRVHLRAFPWEVRWDVFEPNGVWLGTVTIPSRFEPVEIGDDYLLGITQDDDDVEYIRMFALTKP